MLIMTEQFSCNHFSLNLPAGEDQSSIPKLLKHLASTIETMDSEMKVQDITFNMEMDDNGKDLPYFTVYFYPSNS